MGVDRSGVSLCFIFPKKNYFLLFERKKNIFRKKITVRARGVSLSCGLGKRGRNVRCARAFCLFGPFGLWAFSSHGLLGCLVWKQNLTYFGIPLCLNIE